MDEWYVFVMEAKNGRRVAIAARHKGQDAIKYPEGTWPQHAAFWNKYAFAIGTMCIPVIASSFEELRNDGLVQSFIGDVPLRLIRSGD
jgi:hypothetical protein